eukprot:548489-Prorocentrum_lima.AAC.1
MVTRLEDRIATVERLMCKLGHKLDEMAAPTQASTEPAAKEPDFAEQVAPFFAQLMERVDEMA